MRLTRREHEILVLITNGLTNAEIGEQLTLSINSIKTYIRQAYRKIDVERRAQAVAWGMTNGLGATLPEDLATHRRGRRGPRGPPRGRGRAGRVGRRLHPRCRGRPGQLGAATPQAGPGSSWPARAASAPSHRGLGCISAKVPSVTSSASPSAQPLYEDLAALPAYTVQSVPAAFEDVNGHLNIRHYVGIASEGLDESLNACGIPQNWPTVAGSGIFSAEHHMLYLAELRTGDQISVRVRLLARSERAMHVLVYLLDDTHRRISYVMEEIFLHVDMDSRRTAPWPEDVAAMLDARVAEHAALSLPAPVSGSMALR